MWAFDWGVFWAVLAALLIYALVVKGWEHRETVWPIAVMLPVVLAVIVFIGMIFSSHVRDWVAQFGIHFKN